MCDLHEWAYPDELARHTDLATNGKVGAGAFSGRDVWHRQLVVVQVLQEQRQDVFVETERKLGEMVVEKEILQEAVERQFSKNKTQ